MRVALNLVYLVAGQTGGRETYARQLLEALRRRGDVEPVVLLNRLTAAQPDPFWGEAVTIDVDTRSRPAWARAEIFQVPRAAAAAGAEIVHGLGNFGPARSAMPRVVTIHDVLHRVHPELVPQPSRLATDLLMRLAARRAQRVIAPSQASARDAVRYLGARPDRVRVIPNGVAEPGQPGALPVAVPAEGAVVYYPALAIPHKNHARVIAALALIPPERRPLLVLTGAGSERYAGMPGVLALGQVRADEVEALYGRAAAVVLPSLFEGFGLPVLEAMKRGVPVVASDIPALREVAGNAAELVDPLDSRSIANGIERVLGDAALAAQLRDRGRAQAAAFTWDEAARATFAVYSEALDGGG